MIIKPTGDTVETSEYIRHDMELLEDESIEDLTWRVKYAKRSQKWTAYASAGDTYVIRSRGITNLIHVYFKGAGSARGARPERIASVLTFAQALICAETHHRRITNSRGVNERERGAA